VKILILVSLLLMSSQVYAVAPVHDSLAWVQSMLVAVEVRIKEVNDTINNANVLKNLRSNLKQLKQLERQYMQIKRQGEMLSGKHGYGRWLKGPAQLIDPSFRPKTRKQWMEVMSSGSEYEDPVKKNGTKQDKKENDINVDTYALKNDSTLTDARIIQSRENIAHLVNEMDDAETVADQLAVQSALSAELNNNITVLMQIQSSQARLRATESESRAMSIKENEKFNRY